MRVIIAGGGTGGHLFPGVALAEELLARGDAVSFVGTARGIEARVVPELGLPLDLIDVGGLKGSGQMALLRGLLRLPRAWLQARAILARRRPELVVGVGGYASGPLVLAAWLQRLPTAILEQNSVPGITNRILGRLVGGVFASFDESRRFFPAGRVELLGNPIRRSLRLALDAAMQQSGAATQHHRVLVLGGSQGAHAVNALVEGAVGHWVHSGALGPHGALRALRLRHQSGAAEAEALRARYAALGLGDAVEVSAFIEDMAAAYAAADLVIARAGATTIAELTAIGRAAILVPFPQAADDHQTRNAAALASRGAAVLLPQSEATGPGLAALAQALLSDDPRRESMAAAARALGRPDAARAIADRLAELARPIGAP